MIDNTHMAIAHRIFRASRILVLIGSLAAALTGWPGTHSAAAEIPLLIVDVGEGTLLHLPRPATGFLIANPDIADVQVNDPGTVVVFGVKTGRTTLHVLDANGGEILARDIRVQHNLSMLRETLRQRFPNENVTLTSLTNTLIVEGSVDTPQVADDILAILRGVIGPDDELVNRMTIETPTQVNIRIRVAEVSRSIDQRLGINWQALFQAGDFVFGLATGRDFLVPNGTFGNGQSVLLPSDGAGAYLGQYRSGKVSIDALIDALAQEGLARTLAEPNLTAVSGKRASFLAGGEFPIPVARDDDDYVTIEFKPFGVALDFIPTVLSSDLISLTVRPEVSDLSDNGAVEVQGLRIPALTVRRVETTVELGSGQSLVLGGLLQQGTRDLVTKLPGLADLPVLGALFTSTSYQRNETELVVIVTPYIVRPTAPDALETALGRYAPSRPLEELLLKRQGSAEVTGPKRLHGNAGFIF